MLATDLPRYKEDKARTLYTQVLEKLFQSLNKTFISDRLLQDTLNDARQRALVLVGVLVVSAVSGLSMALGLTALYAFNREPLYLAAIVIAVITVLGYLCTLWYFKVKQALLPAARYYGITTTFSTVMPCVITGGISASPYATVILVVPIFLFLIVMPPLFINRHAGDSLWLLDFIGVVVWLVGTVCQLLGAFING